MRSLIYYLSSRALSRTVYRLSFIESLWRLSMSPYIDCYTECRINSYSRERNELNRLSFSVFESWSFFSLTGPCCTDFCLLLRQSVYRPLLPCRVWLNWTTRDQLLGWDSFRLVFSHKPFFLFALGCNLSGLVHSFLTSFGSTTFTPRPCSSRYGLSSRPPPRGLSFETRAFCRAMWFSVEMSLSESSFQSR